MKDIIKSYIEFKKILPKNNKTHINFDNYTKILKESNLYEKKAENLLKYFKNIKISPKKFIAFIIICNFPEVVADNQAIENSLIINKCKIFFANLQQIETCTDLNNLLILD